MSARRLFRDERGTTAAEFALILPVMLLLLLGVIDTGMYTWRINQAEKAAQMGVRYAVVTNLVASGLASEDYVDATSCGATLTAGDTICAAALGKLLCSSTGNCTCATSPCPGSLTRDTAAFDNVVARVRAMAPWVTAANVKIEYTGSGLGYAGDPDLSIAPLVTVRLEGMTYQPISGVIVGGSFQLPAIGRSLTMEDGKGARSN